MNRIYQGGVRKVEIPDGKDNWQPLDPDPKIACDKWRGLFWHHHELFQDAVNYYIVALASLGRVGNSPLTQLRDGINAVWERVEKQGERRDGMGTALAKRFGFSTSVAWKDMMYVEFTVVGRCQCSGRLPVRS